MLLVWGGGKYTNEACVGRGSPRLLSAGSSVCVRGDELCV